MTPPSPLYPVTVIRSAGWHTLVPDIDPFLTQDILMTPDGILTLPQDVPNPQLLATAIRSLLSPGVVLAVGKDDVIIPGRRWISRIPVLDELLETPEPVLDRFFGAFPDQFPYLKEAVGVYVICRAFEGE